MLGSMLTLHARLRPIALVKLSAPKCVVITDYERGVNTLDCKCE